VPDSNRNDLQKFKYFKEKIMKQVLIIIAISIVGIAIVLTVADNMFK
tara:strand:- start:24706 stop:24846 length:141 start_codon:yes stop_codon:yes gene_type:complete